MTRHKICNHTLLHVDWKEAEGIWRLWLLAAGAQDVDPFEGPHFTKEEMAVRAALDGEGIALIGDRMAEDHLSSGRLVRPFDANFSTKLEFAYHLLCPIDRLNDRKIASFHSWLLEGAKREDAVEPSSDSKCQIRAVAAFEIGADAIFLFAATAWSPSYCDGSLGMAQFR